MVAIFSESIEKMAAISMTKECMQMLYRDSTSGVFIFFGTIGTSQIFKIVWDSMLINICFLLSIIIIMLSKFRTLGDSDHKL